MLLFLLLLIACESVQLHDEDDEILNKCYDAVKCLVQNEMFLEAPSGEGRSLIPPNMLQLVQCSKEEIEKKRLLAKIRFIESKIHWREKRKSEIADYFHAIEIWPNYAIKILLSDEFRYKDRLSLACFMHGNGLKSGEKGLHIFQIYNQHWNPRS